LKFKFQDPARPPLEYSLVFGDYVLVQWTHSGNPYWSDRVIAEQQLRENVFPGSRIIKYGTVYCPTTGLYHTTEDEFMLCMKLLRAELIKEE
jgi:hypothetical protein